MAKPSDTIKGDPRAVEIFWAVGHASSVWEQLESILAEIFVLLIKSKYPFGRRAYGSIAAFNVRADMIMAAAESYFGYFDDPEGFAALKKLLKFCRTLSKTRNEVIHSMCVEKRELGARTFLLVPSWYSSRKRSVFNEPKYLMATKEITSFIDEIWKANEQATELYKHLALSRPRPLPKKLRVPSLRLPRKPPLGRQPPSR
jgi:hypothetical protein